MCARRSRQPNVRDGRKAVLTREGETPMRVVHPLPSRQTEELLR